MPRPLRSLAAVGPAGRGSPAPRAFRALFAALVAAQVGYSRLPEERRVAATRSIVGLMLATSVAEARGRRALIAVAGGVGFSAELLGVATGRPFGHYTYSDKLGPRVGGVPVLAAAAWAMMARPAWVVARLITRRRAARVAAAAGALTAWDVFLDPRMVREGYWTWTGGGAYEDGPLSNFLGWFVTGAAAFAVWSVVDDDAAAPPGAGGPLPAAAPPGARGDGALALYVWTWVGETFASAVLWRRPRVALAGGVAMGAFAVPALLARRR